MMSYYVYRTNKQYIFGALFCFCHRFWIDTQTFFEKLIRYGPNRKTCFESYVTETTYLHFKIHETCKKTKISKLNSVKNELRWKLPSERKKMKKRWKLTKNHDKRKRKFILKWKRQLAAVVHFLAENISYSFRIYGHIIRWVWHVDLRWS